MRARLRRAARVTASCDLQSRCSNRRRRDALRSCDEHSQSSIALHYEHPRTIARVSDATGEVVEVLQALIRNACVNDGSDDSGNEARSVDVLRALVEGPGVDVQTFASRPGRESLVARIEGSDPDAPSL